MNKGAGWQVTMLGQLVRLARGAHDSAGKCIFYHLTFISLAGIIRVSIAEMKLGVGLRGSASKQRWEFQAKKKRAAAVG